MKIEFSSTVTEPIIFCNSKLCELSCITNQYLRIQAGAQYSSDLDSLYYSLSSNVFIWLSFIDLKTVRRCNYYLTCYQYFPSCVPSLNVKIGSLFIDICQVILN